MKVAIFHTKCKCFLDCFSDGSELLLFHNKVCRLEYLKTSRMTQYSNMNTFHTCMSLELVFQSDASEH